MKPLLTDRLIIAASPAWAQNTPASKIAPMVSVLQIDAGRTAGDVSATHCGLMTEEINFNFSSEGGIYGELIRNRTFKSNTHRPVFWSTVVNEQAAGESGGVPAHEWQAW